MKLINPKCKNCKGESVKSGKRKNKIQTIQIYLCKNKNCKRYNKKFTLQQTKTTYPF